MKKTTGILMFALCWLVTAGFGQAQPCNLTVVLQKTGVDCYGGSNGTVTANAGGGTGTYTYLWSNGATSQTITGLTTGPYTVTVTSGACTKTIATNVPQPALLSGLQIIQDASCYGVCDGTDSIKIMGGTPPYTVLWSTGATTRTITGLCAGTYTCTITDSKGCERICIRSLVEPAQMVVTPLSADASCFSLCDGTAGVTVVGGKLPIKYLWSNGATTSSIVQLCKGPYTVTVSDSSNCSQVLTLNVGAPSALTVSHQVKNLDCNGICNGEDKITIAGGTPPYSILWNTGATTETITGLCAGTYTVTVTDSKGCTHVCSHAVTQPDLLEISASKTNLKCFGECIGTALATATGGTLQYSYLWTNNATAAAISGLCASIYGVKVTDGLGCTATTSVEITGPASALAVTHTSTNVTCYGACNGTDVANPSGGTEPYSYLWSNGATTKSITGLCAATYTVTVTDANNCSVSCSKVITQPSLFAATTCKTDVKCFNSCNGTAQATPAGGTAPYTYKWNNNATSATITGLCANTYTVIITDAGGCTATSSVTIGAPSALTVNVDVVLATAPGSLTANPAGGTVPYRYLWSTGSTLQSITGLVAGTYTVTVTDYNNCTATANATISIPCGGFHTETQCGWGENCNTSCYGGHQHNSNCGYGSQCNGWNSNNNNNCNWGWNNNNCNNWGWGNNNNNNNNNCNNNNNNWGWGNNNNNNNCNNNNNNWGWGNNNNNNNCNNNNNNWSWGNNNNNNCNNNNNNNNNNCNNNNNNWSWGNNNNNNCNNNNNNNNNNCNNNNNNWSWGNNNNNNCNNNNNNNCNINWSWGCGNWSSNCNNWGNNCNNSPCVNSIEPGCYVQTNFAAAFPNGLVVGCATGNKLKLTTANAIKSFLPSNGTAKALNSGTMTNPGSNYDNTFAGNVVALALNIGFDIYDPNFSLSGTPFSAQVIASGTFNGWTVLQLFNEANKKLGGCASSYSFTTLNNAVKAINENYEEGCSNDGYLECPGVPCGNRGMVAATVVPEVEASTERLAEAAHELDVYPNPAKGATSIILSNVTDDLKVYIYNQAGQRIISFTNADVIGNVIYFDTQDITAGVYYVTVKSSAIDKIVKLVVL